VRRPCLRRTRRRRYRPAPAEYRRTNDIGSLRYKKNPNKNEVLIIDSGKVKSSGWKTKQKIAKFIRKEIENKLK
jgi:TATA-box binding protein (TBP) (component of TFIID and TFIIIB)